MAFRTVIGSGDNEPGGDFDTFLMACWLHVPTWEGSDYRIQVWTPICDNLNYLSFELYFSPTNNPGQILIYTVVARDASGEEIFSGGSGNLPGFQNHRYDPNGWNSIAISGRMSTQTLQFMVNRVLYDPMVIWHSNHPIHNPTGNGWSVEAGRYAPGVALSDYYMDRGNPFFDLSLASNANKLFSPSNLPVPWGANGELVTGEPPWIYLSGDKNSYMNNYGTGGPWSILYNTVPITDYREIPGPGCFALPGLFPKIFAFDECCHGFLSLDGGDTWTEIDTPGDTMHVAWCDMVDARNDGDYTFVASPAWNRSYFAMSITELFEDGDLIPFVTTGYANAWTMAITKGGQTVVVPCFYSSERSGVRISRDYGKTFSYVPGLPSSGLNPSWMYVALSAGMNVAYLQELYGHMWRSTDQLNTWTELTNSPIVGADADDGVTGRMRCTPNGQTVAVGYIKYNYSSPWEEVDRIDFYLSRNSGVTWNHTDFRTLLPPELSTPEFSARFFSFSWSNDANVILAVLGGFHDVYPREKSMAWISRTYGESWVEADIIKSRVTDGENPLSYLGAVMTCDVSPDGKYMIVVYEGGVPSTAFCMISSDSGETWTLKTMYPLNLVDNGAGYWTNVLLHPQA